MKYIDEYRDKNKICKISGQIVAIMQNIDDGIRIMEVCGTHTTAIFRYGLKGLLPGNLRLLSGPGCPVCVTPNDYIDRAILYSRLWGVIIATFGDMMRVPGSFGCLMDEKANGRDVRVVYSVLDALELAKRHQNREIIFLAVGFETTIPGVAISIKEAKRQGIGNFSVLCGHKLIPPALEALAKDNRIGVKGFLCPGHVSVIIGSDAYKPVAKKYKIACVVSGFEPLDIMQSILMLIKQIKTNKARVENQYKRAVKPGGNKNAQRVIDEVFETVDSSWRGIGVIPKSGLAIRPIYKDFDAQLKFKINPPKSKEYIGCICGDILRGIKIPSECRLFGKLCTPQSPKGACMVSTEGACAAWWKYEK